jgi:hypothetical protein
MCIYILVRYYSPLSRALLNDNMILSSVLSERNVGALNVNTLNTLRSAHPGIYLSPSPSFLPRKRSSIDFYGNPITLPYLFIAPLSFFDMSPSLSTKDHLIILSHSIQSPHTNPFLTFLSYSFAYRLLFCIVLLLSLLYYRSTHHSIATTSFF